MGFPRRYLVYMAGMSSRLFVPIAQQLVEQLGEQVDSVTVVLGDWRSYRRAQALQLDPRIELVYQHERMNPFHAPAADESQLSRWESQYGLPHLWRYVLAHRMIDHLPPHRQLAYLQAYLEYYDALAKRLRPEVFISGAPDSLPFLTAYRVMCAHGAVPLLITPGRLRGRSFIVENEAERIPGLDAAYSALRGRALTDEEAAQARALREAYRMHRVRPAYFGIGPRMRPIPSVGRFVRLVWQWAMEEDRYVEPDVWQTARRSLATRWKTPWQRAALRRAVRPADGSRPYFYYPVHYEPESTVDVFSTFTRDQLRMIRLAAAALPAGYELYVKENPNMSVGTRPWGFYRAIASIPSVRLVPTHADSYELIRGSAGVVTLAGTTGFEALCCGKPVVLLGHAFYEVFTDGVRRPAGGMERIAAAFQDLLKHPQVDEALLDRFLAATLQRSYPVENEQYRPEVEGPENIRALTACLLDELRYRREQDLGDPAARSADMVSA